MSRMFATVSGVRVAFVLILMTILAGALDVHAQQVPAQPPAEQQQPAAQPAEPQQPAGESSSQQASPEEIGSARKPKVKEYKNLTFNVGGGGSLTNGQTAQFVRGGGGIVAAGVARNYSKYLGLRFDFQWDNLPLRTSALQQAQALSATDHVYSFLFGPIINIPVTKV